MRDVLIPEYDLESLWVKVAAQHDKAPHRTGMDPCPLCVADAHSRCCMSIAEFARIMGVSTAVVARWRRTGFYDKESDEIAVSLGMTPELIW